MGSIRFGPTGVPGLWEIHPAVHSDRRGSFAKTFVAPEYAELGLATAFAEEYRTVSSKGVVRGMHFQAPPHDQDKVVFCIQGAVYDVVLDLRRGSPSFGSAVSFALTGPSGFGLYIPRGCAHGFAVMSESAIVSYRTTSEYAPTHDRGILWSSVPVEWPTAEPVLSERDRGFPTLGEYLGRGSCDFE